MRSDVKLRLCTGTCGRMTRSSHQKKKDHPDTVARVGDGGKCRWCMNHPDGDLTPPKPKSPALRGIHLCLGSCGRMTRHGKTRVADAPDTVTRAKDGKCGWCLLHGEKTAEMTPKAGRPPKADSQRKVSEENVQLAAAEYQAYTAARRARLARRERASMHQQLRSARGQLVTAGSRSA